MPMLKRDYQEAGRKHAILHHSPGQLEPTRWFDANDKRSWQARAYNEGWDLVKPGEIKLMERPRCHGKSIFPSLQQLPKGSQAYAADLIVVDEAAPFTQEGWTSLKTNQGINLDRMPANTAGWPIAAAEHARLLAIAANEDPSRRARLMRSLGRLQKRYGS